MIRHDDWFNHYHKLILWLTTNHQAQRVERQIITNANLNFSSLSQHSFQKLNHLFGISKFKVSDLNLFLSHVLFFDRFFFILFSAMRPWHEKSAEYFCSARWRSVKLSMCWALFSMVIPNKTYRDALCICIKFILFSFEVT